MPKESKFREQEQEKDNEETERCDNLILWNYIGKNRVKYIVHGNTVGKIYRGTFSNSLVIWAGNKVAKLLNVGSPNNFKELHSSWLTIRK